MKEYIVQNDIDNPTNSRGYMCGRTISQLIRCKDCKHFINSNEQCRLIDTRLHFYEREKRWTEDSFCSWAERKEE